MLASFHTGFNPTFLPVFFWEGKMHKSSSLGCLLLRTAMWIVECIYLTYLVSQHIWEQWTQHGSAALYFRNFWLISALSDSISQNKYITYCHTHHCTLFQSLYSIHYQCHFKYTNWDDHFWHLILLATEKKRKQKTLLYCKHVQIWEYSSCWHSMLGSAILFFEQGINCKPMKHHPEWL